MIWSANISDNFSQKNRGIYHNTQTLCSTSILCGFKAGSESRVTTRSTSVRWRRLQECVSAPRWWTIVSSLETNSGILKGNQRTGLMDHETHQVYFASHWKPCRELNVSSWPPIHFWLAMCCEMVVGYLRSTSFQYPRMHLVPYWHCGCCKLTYLLVPRIVNASCITADSSVCPVELNIVCPELDLTRPPLICCLCDNRKWIP